MIIFKHPYFQQNRNSKVLRVDLWETAHVLQWSNIPSVALLKTSRTARRIHHKSFLSLHVFVCPVTHNSSRTQILLQSTHRAYWAIAVGSAQTQLKWESQAIFQPRQKVPCLPGVPAGNPDALGCTSFLFFQKHFQWDGANCHCCVRSSSGAQSCLHQLKWRPQTGFKSWRVETAFIIKLSDKGSYIFAYNSPPMPPLNFYLAFLAMEAPRRLTVTACAELKLRAVVRSSTTAAKPSFGLPTSCCRNIQCESSLLISCGRSPWVPPLKLITADRGNRSSLVVSS